MKLLLTSNGLCNKTIVKTLADLLGKPFEKSTIAFIPTAANVEVGSKLWLINDMNNCVKAGFETVDIVDISALSKDEWLPRLEAADVLLFGGGNTFHLIYWMRKSGLDKLLPKLLKKRIYIGISAGTMVTGSKLVLSQSKKLYYPDIKGYQDDTGLGLVNFQTRVHLNSPSFPNVRKRILENLTNDFKEPIYAFDDETAIKVDRKKIEVVGDGVCFRFN